MIYIILIILLVIGTLGAATYGGVLLLQTTQGMSDTQTNQRRLEMVAWNLRNSGNLNNASRLEAATSGSYSMPDPSLFATPFTAGGINFHYCPYSSLITSGTIFAVPTPSAGNDYNVQFAYAGDQKYVVNQSVAVDGDAPPDTLHLVTMPSASSASPPQCNALTTSNNTTTVPGGSVVAVTARQAFNKETYSASKVMNLYVGSAVSGDGTGRDASNAMTLDQAMETWRTFQPLVTIINFAGSAFSADSATLASTNLNLGNPTGIKLVWRGAGAGATSINVTGTVSVDFPVDFQMEGLTFGSGATTLYARKGGNIAIDGVALTLNRLVVTGNDFSTVGTASTVNAVATTEINPGGQLSLLAPLTYASAASPVLQLYGGEIKGGGHTANGSLTVNAPNGGTGIVVTGGMINTNQALSISAPSGILARGILVMPAGQLNSRGTITVGTVGHAPTVAAIDNAGAVALDGGALLMPGGGAVGVRLISGGQFSLGNNGVIGSAGTPAARPVIGVQDLGGTKIGGGNVTYPGTVYATALCWTGTSPTPNLFSSSAEGNGLYSNSTAGVSDGGSGNYDFLLIDNRSTWLCTR